jgi:hypothetical protein
VDRRPEIREVITARSSLAGSIQALLDKRYRGIQRAAYLRKQRWISYPCHHRNVDGVCTLPNTLAQQDVDLDGENVLFLIGAGRSGTTLLYKILAAHRQVGYLSNYQARCPSWPGLAVLHRLPTALPILKRMAWFEASGGAYFNTGRPWFKSWVPTPGEAEPVFQTCGLPWAPAADFVPDQAVGACLISRFERVRKLGGTKVLLTKRTANNRRLPQLRRLLPGAKYIHLVRDGRAVAYSLLRVHWWDDHLLYWSGKTPRQLVEEGADPLDLAARNWVEEMATIEQGIGFLDRSRLLEVRYDNLLSSPRAELQRILEFMGVAIDDAEFWALIDFLRLEPKQESWVSRWSTAQLARVTTVQGEMLRRWGFA